MKTASQDFANQVQKARARTLGNFVVRIAAPKLGFTEAELESYLGVQNSEATTSGIDPNSPSGARALALVVIARCLKSILGDDESNYAHWMSTKNRAFGQSPKGLLLSSPDAGSREVQHYCEFMENA